MTRVVETIKNKGSYDDICELGSNVMRNELSKRGVTHAVVATQICSSMRELRDECLHMARLIEAEIGGQTVSDANAAAQEAAPANTTGVGS